MTVSSGIFRLDFHSSRRSRRFRDSGPSVQIYTATHPMNAEPRRKPRSFARASGSGRSR
jgi:hypothetical protein